MQPFHTLIQVFTHLLIFPEGIANGASAFIGPKGVHAAESTEQRILGTLVDIFTIHHGSWLKAFVAIAFKTPNRIGACPISTWIADGTLVSIHTAHSSVIQVVAHRTFTAKRPVGVDTLTIGTDAWALKTLVDIFTCVMKTRDSSMAIWTQILECNFVVFGAQLTGVTPAFSWHLTAAAFCFRGVESFGH